MIKFVERAIISEGGGMSRDNLPRDNLSRPGGELSLVLLASEARCWGRVLPSSARASRLAT